jgi:hypothetical protein
MESSEAGGFELSVVMPCLNEAETLEICVGKAQRAMQEHGIHGEVVVADNGSEDGSIAIAERLGARVVHVSERGYGSALMGGIAAAHGRFVIMGDADDSYDFLEVPRFVEGLRKGADLVQGCRLPWGGGTVLPGAMPPLHRWLGNPLFTLMARRMFGVPIHDAYCGMRGFSRECYERLKLRCTGMEFAIEMLVKASLRGERIEEVPITLHPDKRTSHGPHLRTFRDGWRTVRFFLLHSPRWLFLVPGAVLMALGCLGYALALPGISLFGVRLDAHTLLVSSREAVLRRRLPRAGPGGERRRHPARPRAPWRRPAPVERSRLRRSRLRAHDALGRARSDALGARVPDPSLELHGEPPGDVPSVSRVESLLANRVRVLTAAPESGTQRPGPASQPPHRPSVLPPPRRLPHDLPIANQGLRATREPVR